MYLLYGRNVIINAARILSEIIFLIISDFVNRLYRIEECLNVQIFIHDGVYISALFVNIDAYFYKRS